MHPVLYGCRFGLIVVVIFSKKCIHKNHGGADVCSLFLLGIHFFKQTIYRKIVPWIWGLSFHTHGITFFFNKCHESNPLISGCPLVSMVAAFFFKKRQCKNFLPLMLSPELFFGSRAPCQKVLSLLSVLSVLSLAQGYVHLGHLH